MRQPTYISLHDTPLLIAEWLESAGWPSAGSPAWQSQQAIADAEHQIELRDRLLAEAVAMAERNSSFAPAVGRAQTLVATASTRLARARSEAIENIDRRWPARIEAERLLDLAAANGDITAVSEYQKTADARPKEIDPVPAAAFRRDDRVIRRHRSEICAPWGQHRDVRFAIAELEDWWAATRNLDEPARQQTSDDPSRGSKTVSKAALLKQIEELGDRPENQLVAALRAAFPGKHFSRQSVRELRSELFGPPRRGAPKKSRN